MRKGESFYLIIILIILFFVYIIFGDYNNDGTLKKPNKNKTEIKYEDYATNEINSSSDNTDGSYKNYYYNQLNDTQKEIYSLLEKEEHQLHSSVRLNNAYTDDAIIASYALNMDYPELFWTDKYTYITKNNYITEIIYEIPNNATELMEEIDIVVGEILAEIDNQKLTNDYDILKYFYEWIIRNTEYGDGSNSQNIRSVFLEDKSVCEGYSKAFQYLCKRKNIECTYVTGYTKGNISHGWNLVKLNNNYYWVDVTWGDPVYAGEQYSSVNYNYFLVDDEELFKNHEIEHQVMTIMDETINKFFYYPSCIDKELNYYRLNNSYFEYYDIEAISYFFRDKFKNGIYEGIELKFADKSQYEKFVYDYLQKEDARIYDDIKAVNRLFYGTVLVKFETIDSAFYTSVSISLN